MPTVDGSLRRSGYGATELRQYYQKYMVFSLALSIVLQVVLVTAFYAFRAPEKTSELPRIAEFVPYRSLIPPSLFQTNIPSSASRSSVAKSTVAPNFAIPIPVEDPIVDSNNTVPSQRQPWANDGVFGDAAFFGNVGDQAISLDDDNVEPPPFRPIEKTPEIVRRVEPKYPESAVRGGIEGSVILNIWVDKTGKVRRAVVLRSDAEILNSSAIEAAMQWVFTPAIMQRAPVSVWVSIPFRFRLRDK